ncbi:MAG: hypothetical protein M1343_11480 [Chloroflexi bacterium]|nr:hypothetical protein [Chloroflexota bacterium]MDA8186897.1 hypothetical protein [Dehalococcoidales bacterium]
MIEVHLFGKLRRFGPHADKDRECVIQTSADATTSVGELLISLGIPLEEVSNVFLDGVYTRAAFEKPVAGVARIGLFPRDMCLLYA